MHGSIPKSPRAPAQNPLQFDFSKATQNFASLNRPQQQSNRGFFDDVNEQIACQHNIENQYIVANPNTQVQYMSHQSIHQIPQVNAHALLSFNPHIDQPVNRATPQSNDRRPEINVENSNIANFLLSHNPNTAYNNQPTNQTSQLPKTKSTTNIFSIDKTMSHAPNAHILLSNDLNQTYPKNDHYDKQQRDSDFGFLRSRTQTDITNPVSYTNGLNRTNTFQKKCDPITNADDSISIKSGRRLTIFEESPRTHRSLQVNQNASFNSKSLKFEMGETPHPNLLSNYPNEQLMMSTNEKPRSSLRHVGSVNGLLSSIPANPKADTKNQREEFDHLNSKLSSAQAEICDLKLQMSTISEHKKYLERRVAALKEENSHYKSENENLKSNEISLKVQLDNSKRVSSCVEHGFRISQLEMENTELREKYQSLKISLSSVSTNPENDAMAERVLKLEAFIKDLKRKNELLEAQLNG